MAGGVLEVWGWDLARGRGETNEGVLQVLMRTKGRELGHFPELSTATARWRPRSPLGMAWRGEEVPAQGEVGPGVRGGAT